jgi:thymidylate synthase (FAD)
MNNNFTKRSTINHIDEILGQKIDVLDFGFISVVDYMGCDSDIANAARVSYGNGTKTVNQDEGLIRYLMRHRHTTPFEMCEIKMHLKMPIFIARQWMRHRTANVNEISARYSIIKDEYYVPEIERMSQQSAINNQGSGDRLPDDLANNIKKEMNELCADTFLTYDELINEKHLARELARSILPQSTYTEFFWKIDLHNLLHFVSLRADSHAQYEIQQYAIKILDIVKSWLPFTYKAFMDYRMNSMSFTGFDLGEMGDFFDKDKILSYIAKNEGSKKGEVKELCAKLKKFI